MADRDTHSSKGHRPMNAIVMDHKDVAAALATGRIASTLERSRAGADHAAAEPGMAITTTVKALRAALMSCGKVVASRSSVPILECVRIDGCQPLRNDYVSVSGTDMDVAVTVTLQSDVYTAGAVAVPLKPLKKTLVKRKAGEPVSIEADSRG